jgi:cytidylate kinase
VAAALDAAYLNTGAYYRAATLAILLRGADPTDPAAAVRVVSSARFDFVDARMLLDGRDVTTEIRSPEVTAAVTPVAAMPEVRRSMVDRQREWVARHGGDAVVEGRDIGTVVFPDAPVKVFLTASEAARALRRSADAEAAGQEVGAVAERMRNRDRADAGREASPMVAAEDAVVIDTTTLTADEVVAIVLRLVAPA